MKRLFIAATLLSFTIHADTLTCVNNTVQPGQVLVELPLGTTFMGPVCDNYAVSLSPPSGGVLPTTKWRIVPEGDSYAVAFPSFAKVSFELPPVDNRLTWGLQRATLSPLWGEVGRWSMRVELLEAFTASGPLVLGIAGSCGGNTSSTASLPLVPTLAASWSLPDFLTFEDLSPGDVVEFTISGPEGTTEGGYLTNNNVGTPSLFELSTASGEPINNTVVPRDGSIDIHLSVPSHASPGVASETLSAILDCP